jgi:hypothetical protein
MSTHHVMYISPPLARHNAYNECLRSHFHKEHDVFHAEILREARQYPLSTVGKGSCVWTLETQFRRQP